MSRTRFCYQLLVPLYGSIREINILGVFLLSFRLLLKIICTLK